MKREEHTGSKSHAMLLGRCSTGRGAGIDCRFHVANDFLTEFLARRLATCWLTLLRREPAKPAERMGIRLHT